LLDELASVTLPVAATLLRSLSLSDGVSLTGGGKVIPEETGIDPLYVNVEIRLPFRLLKTSMPF
jgi:hypothetical protein